MYMMLIIILVRLPVKTAGNWVKKNIPRNYHGMFNITGGWWGVPWYTITKIYKNLVPAIFMIFLIVYSRIRHARQLFTKISFSYGTVVPWRSCASTHPTLQNKKWPIRVIFYFGGSGWIRTTSGLSQQIYSLPRLSNSGARPELFLFGAGSGTRTRTSSLEGLRTSPCTMPANFVSPLIIS